MQVELGYIEEYLEEGELAADSTCLSMVLACQ